MVGKKCEMCGEMFFKNSKISPSQWIGRRFCSLSCSAKSKIKAITIKTCLYCTNKILVRPGQTKSSYDRQKYCSLSCAGKSNLGTTYKGGGLHTNWNGGLMTAKGYIKVLVGNSKYVSLHKIIMEWYLGRTLESVECVHHCNGKVDDNRLDNLELMTKSSHGRLHGTEPLTRPSSREKANKTKRENREKYVKENHGCWKKDVNKDSILAALKNNDTKKKAAKELGICTDTLRARIKYLKEKGESCTINM